MLPHLGQQFLPTLEREGTLSSAERTLILDYTRRELVHATLLSHSKSVLFLRPPSHDGRTEDYKLETKGIFLTLEKRTREKIDPQTGKALSFTSTKCFRCHLFSSID